MKLKNHYKGTNTPITYPRPTFNMHENKNHQNQLHHLNQTPSQTATANENLTNPFARCSRKKKEKKPF